MVIPVATRFLCFLSALFKLIEKLGSALSISIPKKINTPEPIKEIMRNKNSELIKRTKPNIIHMIIPTSSSAWPTIMSGPDFAPCLVLSCTTDTSSGPGAKAPEKAMKNESKKIET